MSVFSVSLVVLFVGLVAVWGYGTWRLHRAEQHQRQADQTAANARALHRLAEDVRRRTKHDQDDEDSLSRYHHPRRSDSETTQRRRG